MYRGIKHQHWKELKHASNRTTRFSCTSVFSSIRPKTKAISRRDPPGMQVVERTHNTRHADFHTRQVVLLLNVFFLVISTLFFLLFLFFKSLIFFFLISYRRDAYDPYLPGDV